MPYTPLPTPPWGFTLFPVGYSALVRRQIVWNPQGKNDPYWTVYDEAKEPIGGNIPIISALLLTSDFNFDPDMENVEDCTGPGRTSPTVYWNAGAVNDGFPNEIKNGGVVIDGANEHPGDPLYWSSLDDPRKSGGNAYRRNGGYNGTGDYPFPTADQDVRVAQRTSEYDPSTGSTILKAWPFGWTGDWVRSAGGSGTPPPLNDGTGRHKYLHPLTNVPDLKYLLIYARNTISWVKSTIEGTWGNEDATADPGYGMRQSIPIAVMDLNYTNPKFVEGVSSEADRYKFTGDLSVYFKDMVMMRVPGRVT